MQDSTRLSEGLSPRVRGNQCVTGRSSGHSRSIPARAGEPHHSNDHMYMYTVYPRACGGTMYSVASLATLPGLSPRVRGNRARLR